MLPKSPCIDCLVRVPGCQDNCETGQAYSEALRQLNNEIKKERLKEREANNFKIEQIMKMKEAAK